MRRDVMKEEKGESREASPREHFTGKIRKISSQDSVWQKKEVDSPGNRIGSQMAKDNIQMLPIFAQSKRREKLFLKLESHLYITDSPNNEVCT